MVLDAIFLMVAYSDLKWICARPGAQLHDCSVFCCQFHLEQAKERSRIRIEDGRAKAIDLLAKYINAEDDDMSIEMHEPYTYLEVLILCFTKF